MPTTCKLDEFDGHPSGQRVLTPSQLLLFPIGSVQAAPFSKGFQSQFFESGVQMAEAQGAVGVGGGQLPAADADWNA